MNFMRSRPAKRRAFAAGLLAGSVLVGVGSLALADGNSTVTIRPAATEAPSPTDVPTRAAAQFVVQAPAVSQIQADEESTTTTAVAPETTTTTEAPTTTEPEATTTTVASPPSTWADPLGWGQEVVADMCGGTRENLAKYNRVQYPRWCEFG